MKQKFIIKHLASWSPLVRRILEHVASHTTNNEVFPIYTLPIIVSSYLNRVPKGIFDYRLEQNNNEWCLWEDEEMVLNLELIEIYELENVWK